MCHPHITLAANSYFQAFFYFQSTSKGHWCKFASDYPGTLICVEIHVKMWTLHGVKGIRPFVGVTLAMVKNNPAIRLVCVIISSVLIRRPDLKQGWRRQGGMGRRGIAPSPPGTGLQRCVSSGRDMPAGGCLRTAGVWGAGLRQGWRFAPVPHRKGHSWGTYPEGSRMFSGRAQTLPTSGGMSEKDAL